MAKRVITVAKANPQMIVLAIGAQTSDLPLIPIAIGSNPKMVVIEVNITGLNLVFPAKIRDFQRESPLARELFTKLISTIASLTATPARATMAKRVVILKGLRIIESPTIAPIKAKGMVNIMIKG